MRCLLLLTITAAALSLGACASTRWIDPPTDEMTPRQAAIARDACINRGMQMVAIKTSNIGLATDSVRDCLMAHGFREVPR